MERDRVDQEQDLDRRLRNRFAGFAAAFALLGFLMFLWGWLEDRDDAEANQKIDKLASGYEVLYDQVQETPGVEPEAPPVEDITDSEVVPIPGPQGEQGDQGPRGEPGPSPSLTMVEQAIRLICGDCVGPPGPTGETGSVGATGTPGESIVGPEGPAGSAGPIGPQGEQGPQGVPGPGPASFTFSDGGKTWVCTDPESDLTYTCEQTEPPPVEVTLP